MPPWPAAHLTPAFPSIFFGFACPIRAPSVLDTGRRFTRVRVCVLFDGRFGGDDESLHGMCFHPHKSDVIFLTDSDGQVRPVPCCVCAVGAGELWGLVSVCESVMTWLLRAIHDHPR